MTGAMILLRIEELDDGQEFVTCVTNKHGVVMGRPHGGGGFGVPVLLWDAKGNEEHKSICGQVLVRPA